MTGQHSANQSNGQASEYDYTDHSTFGSILALTRRWWQMTASSTLQSFDY